MKNGYLVWIITHIVTIAWWLQKRIRQCTRQLRRTASGNNIYWHRKRPRMATDRRKVFEFRPFKLIRIDYKAYRGIFREGIHSYPKPRSGHRIVCNDTNLFVFGGFNPDSPSQTSRRQITYLFQEMWKFNILTYRWTLCYNPRSEDMPEELASNTAIMKNDMVLVFGGTGYPFGVKCSNKCYVFCPYANPKTINLLETTGEEPQPQYGQAVAMNGKYLYVVGGTSSFDYSCDIHRLDLLTKNWELVGLSGREHGDPTGRYRHEIALLNNRIYIIGGGTSAAAFSLRNVSFFDMELKKWDRLVTIRDQQNGYPSKRKCHSLIQYETENGSEIVIAGGYDGNTFYNDIWKLNLNTFQWQMFSSRLPNPMYFHDAATSGNGCMFIFGGIEVKGDEKFRTNAVYKMWVTIPKLSEICWETLIVRNPAIAVMEKNELIDLGVPDKFANRVNYGRTMHQIDDD